MGPLNYSNRMKRLKVRETPTEILKKRAVRAWCLLSKAGQTEKAIQMYARFHDWLRKEERGCNGWRSKAYRV